MKLSDSEQSRSSSGTEGRGKQGNAIQAHASWFFIILSFPHVVSGNPEQRRAPAGFPIEAFPEGISSGRE